MLRDRLARLKVELEVMRLNALRTLGSRRRGPGARSRRSISKLLWAELAPAARRARHGRRAARRADRAGRAPYDLDEWQRLFLFSRADTIYGGSDEIQRNILAERVLGLPREPKGDAR